MTLPDTTITRRESAAPVSAAPNTGTAFFAGLAERGPITTWTLITSLSQAKLVYGERITQGTLIDSLETFFQEGGSQAYVQRYDGPAVATATKNLLDGSAGISLIVTAKTPGAWGNNLKIAVLAGDAGGNFKLQVTALAGSSLESIYGTTLETSPDLADTAAAVAWGATATWVNVAQGASTNDPATAAAASLASGADDRASAGTTQQTAALALFTRDLGPGQVAIPGATAAAVHAIVDAHALANDRIALVDMPDTSTVATVTGVAATNRALGAALARLLGQLWPWATIPGLLPGLSRTVPLSAAVAGVIARLDGDTGNPNEAAAGEEAAFRFVTGFTQAAPTDANRQTLADAGVNVALVRSNRPQLFDFVTATNPVTDSGWLALSNSRLNVAIAANAKVIGDEFLFRQLDPTTISQFGNRLRAMMLRYHQAGALDGAVASEAFRVDVGNQVNTPATLGQNKLKALIDYSDNGFARTVEIELVKEVV